MYNQNYKEYLESYAWKSIKKAKLEENPKCECCGANATTVHHLSYERIGRENSDDVASVCESCHYECHHVGGYQIKNDEEILRKRFEDVQSRFGGKQNTLSVKETKTIKWDTSVISRCFSLFASSVHIEGNEGNNQGKYKLDGFDYVKFLAYSYDLTLSKCGILEFGKDLCDGENVSINILNLGKNIPKEYFIKYIVYVTRYNRGSLTKLMYKEILQDHYVSGFLNLNVEEIAKSLGLLAYLDLRFCSNALSSLMSNEYSSNILVLPNQEQIDKLRKEFHLLITELGIIPNGLFDIIGNEEKYNYEGIFNELAHKEYIENKLGIRYNYNGINDEYFDNLLK